MSDVKLRLLERAYRANPTPETAMAWANAAVHGKVDESIDEDKVIDYAMTLIESQYRQAVASAVEDLLAETVGPNPNLNTQEKLYDAVWERVDRDRWVIYNRNAQWVLMVSDNSGAYEDHHGHGGGQVSENARAFMAMHEDVLDELGRKLPGTLNNPWACAECGDTYATWEECAECCRFVRNL